jgi:alpha-D-ribose 1-methylphosphonate 5-triphosphate synthase subunit PhnH
MKTIMTLNANSLKTVAFLVAAISVGGTVQDSQAGIIRVPNDSQTVALAVAGATSGDTIILSPGTYNENNIAINKPLTISSEWIQTG